MKKLLIAGVMFLSACGSDEKATVSGIKGDTGPTGEAGTPGMTISSGWGCYKSSGGFIFRYRAVVYSTKDIWVECDVSGTSSQATNTIIYKSGSYGTTNYYCDMTFDSDSTASSGYWKFLNTNGVKTAVYTDSGSSINGSMVSFSASDCVSY